MGFRYIGTKARILTNVLGAIERVAPKGTIADIMCGTSTVSAGLRRMGYSVIANDVMTYSFHHARVSLLFQKAPEFAGATAFINRFGPKTTDLLFPLTRYEQMIRALQNVPPKKGYFWREFSVQGKPAGHASPRNYFNAENAAKIDGMRLRIQSLTADGRITKLEQSLLLHDLIMAANDVANIAGTYGHYMAKLSGRARDPIRLSPTQLLIMPDARKHKVFKGYAEDVAAKISCDVCYIDPPYMKRQYAANYHLLETLARGDEPTAVGASGLRPWRDQYSNFCTKTKIHSSFERIFTEMDCRHFLISYSEDGLLPLKELSAFVSRFGKTRVTSFANQRFRSNEGGVGGAVTEYLVHLYRRN